MPAGVTFEIDAADPVLAQAQQLAFDIDQGKVSGKEMFSRMLALHAGKIVHDQQQISEGRKAEVSKLGAAGPARVDAAVTWLKSQGAEGLAPLLFTAAGIQAVERLITNFTSQGAGSFSQSHRDTPDGNSIPGYETMSFEQRRAAQWNNQNRGAN